MKKQIYEINESGFLKEIYVAKVVDGVILDEDKSHMISATMPNGLIKPKWNGLGWIEGATPKEIEEFNKSRPTQPTEAELLQQRLADMELMLVEIMFN